MKEFFERMFADCIAILIDAIVIYYIWRWLEVSNWLDVPNIPWSASVFFAGVLYNGSKHYNESKT